MADQQGATPADAEPAATADDGATGNDDAKAQELLADAVAADDGGQPDDDEQLGESGKKALQREREARKAADKARTEAEAKVKEFEDRDKSEQQKANERAEEAEKAAEQAKAEALRYRIAAKNEISDEDAEIFLTGTDEDTLTKQAERLVALRGEQAAPRTPKPDPSQGSRGPVDLDAQIADAEKKGDVRASIRLKQEKAAAQRTASQSR